MGNVILRMVASLGLGMSLGFALDAGNILPGVMAGCIYLLFSTTNNDN